MTAGGLTAIGLSGAMAYQSALNVIGNNLANMADPDYIRQVPQFTEKPYGSGVYQSSTDRIYNDYLTTNARMATSNYNQYATYYQFSSDLDSYFGNESSSVSVAMNRFFGALQNSNSNPSSSTARQELLNQANSLISRFQNVQQQLSTQGQSVNQQITSSIQMVNGLTSQVASLNLQLMGGAQDPTLLDQRDSLLKQVSAYFPLSTRTNQDGTIDAYTMNGVPLVTGSTASVVQTMQDPNDPNNLVLAVKNKYYTTNIGNNIQGGSVGGLFQYYNEILKPATLELNRIALVIQDNINQLHQSGVNLNNQLGGNFFSDINSSQLLSSRVTANPNNTGSGTFNVTINDVGSLQDSDYQWSFSNSTDYTLTRNSDGTMVASGSMTSYPASLSVDGYTLTVNSGNFNAGDQFTISPTMGAITNLSLNISEVNQIALAAPIRTAASLTNQGSGNIEFQGVTNINNASFSVSGQLQPPLKIEFLSPTTYQVVNANTASVIEGPLPYVPNTQQSVFPTPGGFDPGYLITLSGAPAAGDSFSVGFNNFSQGDNRNGALLLNLQNNKLVNQGSSTLSEAYSILSGNIASRTNYAESVSNSMEAVMDDAEAQRSNYSGVNDQEELATMMFYLKAFQANSKMIGIADSMFSTMLDLM